MCILDMWIDYSPHAIVKGVRCRKGLKRQHSRDADDVAHTTFRGVRVVWDPPDEENGF